MAERITLPEHLVFGLDIGTRSIVGTVGFLENDVFHAVAQCVKEHTSRAMIDGQIHDIMKVGQTITQVKQELEEQVGRPLKEVCIAAAGRVLRTVTTTIEVEYEEETIIDSEKIYSLDLLGIEKAQEELAGSNETDIHFYCVGYSVIRYYLNGSYIVNLEGHKASRAAEDIIATFLPEEVVDSLYAAVGLAGLEVANLTLEPIAAINVAIPEKFRMLNIGLVDVGAGTSDICLTKDGSITAYGMIPMAGDELTEIISRQYLVDFDMAERIKTNVRDVMDSATDTQEMISYEDIIGISHEVSAQEICELLDTVLDEIATKIADKIKELNGDKSVSAVFVVGGGGKFPGFTDKLAAKLGLLAERVALRGEEVLGQVHFYQNDIKKDSLLVTPIGICLNYYDKKNNFIFVNFNNERIKLYNNNHLTVVEAAMQAGFANDGLFPKRGKELTFTVNGKSRMVRGTLGEAAVVKVNGQPADINTPIDSNDKIEIIPSTSGEAAELTIDALPEFNDIIEVTVNGKTVSCPKFVQVNGSLVSGFYDIQEGDDIVVLNHYTLQQLLEYMDVILPDGTYVLINNKEGTPTDSVYHNFTVDWSLEHNIYSNTEAGSESGLKTEEQAALEEQPLESLRTEEKHADTQKTSAITEPEPAKESASAEVPVIVNGQTILLSGKMSYIFVDVFDYIDFDLKTPHKGSVVTKHNGVDASYTGRLHPYDKIEIYWEE